MSDVFVSYKAEDRRRVQPIVAAFEADGLTVWWDAQIGGGDEWRRSIEQQLDTAKCVLVVWSKRSAGPDGRFVRDEASRAMERDVYLPVRIDNVRLPLGFGETQVLNLARWNGSREDSRYAMLIESVRAIVSGEPHHAHQHFADEPVSRRGLMAGGAVAAVAVAGVGGWFLLKPGPARESSIAVLPFANLSGDPKQAYFSDGIAEEIRSALARIAQLKVVARTSSEMVRNADAKTAAHKLEVANILAGSVRRSPATVRVSAQLIDGRDGLERWSQNYDRPAGDILKIQTDIAESVARSLSIELGHSQRNSLFAGGTDNPQANDLLLQANPEWANGEAGVRRAIALADAAIALDPNYADAYEVKALLQNFLAGQYAPNAAAMHAGLERAATTVKRAISLAPHVGSGYMILATIRANQLQFAEALQYYRRGDRLPGSALGSQRGFSSFLSQLGRQEEAWRKASAILPRDPLNPGAFMVQARILYDWRRYDEAVKYAKRSLELAPQAYGPRLLLGSILIQRGRTGEAQKQLDRLPEDDPYRLAGEGLIAAKRGDRSGVAAKIDEMVHHYGDSMNYQIAGIGALLGDKDKAMAALDRAYAARDPGLASILVDRWLDPLRGDPRFKSLVRKLDFPAP